MGVVEIERDTRTERVDKSEPFVLDGARNQLNQMFNLPGISPRHIGRSGGDGKWNRIERILNTAGWSAFGFHPFRARGRKLASGETIDLIIHDNVCQIYVTAHGVNKMIAANAIPVSISTSGD